MKQEQDLISSDMEFVKQEDIQIEESNDLTKRKYNRISSERRSKLLHKIFFDNKKIKIAAKELNINYSSAKTILHLYRKKNKKVGQKSLQFASKICSFKKINLESQNQSQVQLIISQGGQYLKNQDIDNFEPKKSESKKNLKDQSIKQNLINFITQVGQENSFSQDSTFGCSYNNTPKVQSLNSQEQLWQYNSIDLNQQTQILNNNYNSNINKTINNNNNQLQKQQNFIIQNDILKSQILQNNLESFKKQQMLQNEQNIFNINKLYGQQQLQQLNNIQKIQNDLQQKNAQNRSIFYIANQQQKASNIIFN